jgi:predicted heme/steroid binding protein
LTQFVSAIEKSFLQEHSVRVRSQLGQEIGNQTDFVNKQDRVTASSPTSRERDLVSNALFSDFSYRPTMNWETGFNFGVTEVINHFGGKDATADINEEGMRMVQSFPGVGQLRAELKREEVSLTNITDPNVSLPYEFTLGKAVGQSYLWQLTFDYRITANLQLSLNYNGRKEGGGLPIHFARMEARAFF